MLAYLSDGDKRTDGQGSAARIRYARTGLRGTDGKRSISKEQAKKLATLFKVTVDLFI